MESIFSVLFNQRSWAKHFSVFILIVRIILAYLLFQHAYFKIAGNDMFTPAYLDAFGVGVTKPMAVVLCCEIFCSFSLVLGLLIRLFMFPMMFVALYMMCLGITTEHYVYSELSLLYLMFFVFLYISGAGRYSVDYVAHHWIRLGGTRL